MSEITTFKKGLSGNPMGRPKGSKNKSTALRKQYEAIALESLSEELPDLLRGAIKMAQNGDSNMMKFIIERFVPKASLEEDENKSLASSGITINISGVNSLKEEVIIEHEEDDNG